MGALADQRLGLLRTRDEEQAFAGADVDQWQRRVRFLHRFHDLCGVEQRPALAAGDDAQAQRRQQHHPRCHDPRALRQTILRPGHPLRRLARHSVGRLQHLPAQHHRRSRCGYERHPRPHRHQRGAGHRGAQGGVHRPGRQREGDQRRAHRVWHGLRRGRAEARGVPVRDE